MPEGAFQETESQFFTAVFLYRKKPEPTSNFQRFIIIKDSFSCVAYLKQKQNIKFYFILFLSPLTLKPLLGNLAPIEGKTVLQQTGWNFNITKALG